MHDTSFPPPSIFISIPMDVDGAYVQSAASQIAASQSNAIKPAAEPETIVETRERPVKTVRTIPHL